MPIRETQAVRVGVPIHGLQAATTGGLRGADYPRSPQEHDVGAGRRRAFYRGPHPRIRIGLEGDEVVSVWRDEIHSLAEDAPILAGLGGILCLIALPVLPLVLIGWLIGKCIERATR